MTNLNNLQYKESAKTLISAVANRTLVLDGAMGTMIQGFNLSESDFRGKEFAGWNVSLKGCNDLLNLTRPDVIKEIHLQYLKAGADIIETNSFNSNAVSLADYRLEPYVEEFNTAAARLAREAVDEWSTANPDAKRWVAGSMGPTGKSLSMEAGMLDSDDSNFNWDILVSTYTIQAQALIKGGVDLLIIETAFDTLNAKAAIFAARQAMCACGIKVPVIVSTTLTESGRTLSGQTPEAFAASVSHAEPLAIGLNCGFGAEDMARHLSAFKNQPFAIIAYPNAGLPNEMGKYDETPQSMSRKVEKMLADGLVNIVGGCCGSTPSHIAAIADIAKRYPTRRIPSSKDEMVLSGLESLIVSPERNFLNVGERCNVAGSRKFLRLIKEHSLDEATAIARSQVESGAQVIDINMDDAMLDTCRELSSFIRMISTEPDVARVPVMIDSSRWDAIEGALKCVQGHPIVNSLSLKEGEETFVRRASLVKEYGASLIVMAFDEKGQADTFERKIEICGRAYRILTEKVGFKGHDIVFDPNILTVATGIEAHDRYALDFIRAVEWIKNNLPGAKVSGGVSNLSFAFRGNNYLREAMHACFLSHAIKAGLDMAIVNAANIIPVEEIESGLREAIDDVLLYRRPDATERLVELADKIKNNNQPTTPGMSKQHDAKEMTPTLKVERMLVSGVTESLPETISELIASGCSAVDIIEGPLMNGMNRVGELFGQGKMFLPQVVKSARTMKLAVDLLTPYIKNGENSDSSQAEKFKMVIATVKGDVHDIGKNIVGVILNCNGAEVTDLGVMVTGEEIVDRAIELKADFIGLSGLISPSLDEMCATASIMEQRGLKIPLFVGGATTSPMHTAVKIAPCYSGPVFHTHDAANLPIVIKRLLNPETRQATIEQNFMEQEKLRAAYENRPMALTLEQARTRKPHLEYTPRAPRKSGIIEMKLPLDKVRQFINWRAFMSAWKLDASMAALTEIQGCDHCRAQWLAAVPSEKIQQATQAMQLYKEAQRLIDFLSEEMLADGISAKIAILPAGSTTDDTIVIKSGSAEIEIPTPRQTSVSKANEECLALSDFIAPLGNGTAKDWIGIFAVTVGKDIENKALALHESGDDYRSLLYQTVAHRLAEAATEYLHLLVRTEIWGYSDETYTPETRLSDLKYEGIRPAIGYPSLPDQKLVFTTDSVLDYAKMGISLTENGAMHPSATTTGLIIAHPSSKYFIL